MLYKPLYLHTVITHMEVSKRDRSSRKKKKTWALAGSEWRIPKANTLRQATQRNVYVYVQSTFTTMDMDPSLLF